MLEKELETYERIREELLRKSSGHFALIHGEDLLGVFDTRLDAITQGYSSLGAQAFLVKRVSPEEPPMSFFTEKGA